MERKYFVFRQDYTSPRAALYQEIREGRFRQGWGCAGLDLRKTLDEWIAAYLSTWDDEAPKDAKDRYWILYPMLEVQPGDLILVPKQPTNDSFLLLKAIAADGMVYWFDERPREDRGVLDDDYRHVINIDTSSIMELPAGRCTETLLVSNKFKGYQRAVNNVVNRDVKAAVDRLLEMALVDELPTLEDIIRAEAVVPVYCQVRDKLRSFPPGKLEEIVEGLFRRAGFQVVRRQWHKDGGDVDRVFTLELNAPALLDLIAPDVAVTLQFNVQVKQKTGIDYNDVHGVEQLLIMKTNSPNEYSILISTADSFTEPCRKLAADKGVILIDGIQFAEIILKHFYV